MKLNNIKPNPNNPRLIKDDKFKKLVQSLKDFPQMMALRPIVVNNQMVILGGNMRYKACQELGMKEIPDEWVKIATKLTPEEEKRFIIEDNVPFGEWDYDVLASEWDTLDLEAWGLELPVDWNKQEATEDDYEIPDEIETDIVLWDLFEIGHHRLLCGDSTDADAVGKLLDGGKPILMVTDPPYGVNYDPKWRQNTTFGNRKGKIVATGKVMNDDNCSWIDAYSLFPGDVIYCWHGGKVTHIFAQELIDCGFEIISQIIWKKQNAPISRGDIHWQHEPCWYAVRKGKKHNWQGSRKEFTIWEIQNNSAINVREREGDNQHGTQKPIECMARPIRNNTYERESVYDPFLGSGTTMVAAHQLNRKCYGMEIDPKYCQVIIDRMLKLDSGLIIKKNGIEIR